MFSNLFGWKKASKCKMLLKAVKCRLKLLKNKKCCIMNQLREDAAQLLKYGLDQSALQRVEQLIKDETTVEVYDLLDQFCEHLIINLSYIRKHKECPREIVEAVSTVIFSSARLGELPELLSIRKLFQERYGHRFMMLALELLPGNLVHRQIIEKVYTIKVPDDVKYRVLDEIASSSVQSGPYLLEYRPELQEDQATESSGEVQRSNVDKGTELQLCFGKETDREIMLMDLPSEKFSKGRSSPLRRERFSLNGIQCSDPGELEKLIKKCNATNKYIVALKSSSEASARPPEETIYLNDIESLRDSNQEMNSGICISPEESILRGCRKTRKVRRKRSRRRSMSQEIRIFTDAECAAYYGESEATSLDNKHKSHFRRRKKIVMQGSPKSNCTKVRNRLGHHNHLYLTSGSNATGDIPEKCSSSLDYPCYFNYGVEDDMHKARVGYTIPNRKEPNIQYKIELYKHYQEVENEYRGAGQVIESIPKRAMSMPAERPEEDPTDNILRSISFPSDQPHRIYSSCRHIHPKLPDYDQLAAKFVALKRSNLQISNC